MPSTFTTEPILSSLWLHSDGTSLSENPATLNLSVEDAECTTTEPQMSTALQTGEVRPALVAERQNPIGATTLAG